MPSAAPWQVEEGTAPGAAQIIFLRPANENDGERILNISGNTISTSVGVPSMSEVTREEINAKLVTVEARLETGLVRMEGKIDSVLAEIRHVAEISRDAKEEARQAKIAASNIKWNVGFTVLAAVGALIAVILTMWTITYQVTDTVRTVNPPVSKTSPQ